MARLLFLLLLSWCIADCRKSSENSIVVAASITGYKTLMPHAKGYDAFETQCITCHSLRYIQMQPDFPQKKWEGIVEKMIRNFGAPIPDTTAKAIVAYLAEVKGVK